MSLAKVVEALEDEDADKALGRLVESWAKHRSPRIADLVDLLDGRTRPQDEPLPGGRKKAEHEAWLEIEKDRDHRDFQRLILSMTKGSSGQGTERLERLASRNDVRLGRALLRILGKPPWTARTAKGFWDAVLATLRELGDTRLADPLDELSARYLGICGTSVGEWLQNQLAKIAAELRATRPPRALPPAEEKHLAALEGLLAVEKAAVRRAAKGKQKAARSEEDFLAAVYAAPDEDAPRAVYADWLTERGDPRGEFISLQLARAAGKSDGAGDIEPKSEPEASRRDAATVRGRASPGSQTTMAKHRRRERALRAEHGASWIGPLKAATVRVHFVRGFPGRANLPSSQTGFKKLLGHPAWATVNELNFSSGATIHQERFHEDLVRFLTEASHARRVWNLTPATVTALERPLEGLVVMHTAGNRTLVKTLAERTFSTLGFMAMGAGSAKPYLEPHAGRLACLRLGKSTGDMAAWLDLAAAMEIPRVDIAGPGHILRVEGERLTVMVDPAVPDTSLLEDALKDVPRARVDEVRLQEVEHADLPTPDGDQAYAVVQAMFPQVVDDR
jgi:uncharacterized protein (TIGR02996 family)